MGQATAITFAAGAQSATLWSSITSVSCPTAGNCTAGGHYRDAAGTWQTFTVSSTNGTWAQAAPVVFAAGVQTTTAFSGQSVFVSCVTAGNCTAVGYYQHATNQQSLYTMSSTNGTFGQASAVPFVAPLTSQVNGVVLTCATVDNCAVVGSAISSGGGRESFTLTMTNGVWGSMAAVPFAAGVMDPSMTVNGLNSVTCTSAGNCIAVGSFGPLGFASSANPTRPFAVNLTNGTWGQAVPITFPAGSENSTPQTTATSVSCPSAGNCAVGGTVKNAAGNTEHYVVSSTNGTWGTPTIITFGSGVVDAATLGGNRVRAVSCHSVGNCTMSGSLGLASGGTQVFTASSTNGTWAQGTPISFASGVEKTPPASLSNAMSCTATGVCVHVGRFRSSPSGNLGVVAFVASITGGSTTSTTSTTTTTTTTTTAPAQSDTSSGSTTVAPTTLVPTTLVPTTLAPTTTTSTVVANAYLAAKPGITVTDRNVYAQAPARVAADSSITVLRPAEAKVLEVVARTPDVCLGSDDSLVFVDSGRCVADIVNERSRAVVRTLRTTVVAEPISQVRVGNATLTLRPVYFSTMSATLDAKALATLNGLRKQMNAAGAVLVVGHSGTLNGNSAANRAIARDRANAVAMQLRKIGVKSSILSSSVGALSPASTGKTEADQVKNRRVVITLIP